MKKLFLVIALIFSTTYSFAQVTEYQVKKMMSPQFGKIPAGNTKISISDKIIIITGGKKTVEYNVDSIDETDFSKTYLCKYGSQNDIRFTYFKNDNYLKFENRDNFSGKIGELLYYFN
jgi:hypothetical protein